jgi:glycosyltransferase involved in cell wall biosynthesis
LLAGADVLVQPGAPGVFNDYRFPSKLPEFLVSGRPVIMAATNLGLVLKDGEQALIAGMGSVEEIATAVERLLLDKHLAQRVGSGGQQFARQYLRWELAAQKFRALCHLACVTR